MEGQTGGISLLHIPFDLLNEPLKVDFPDIDEID